MTYALLLYCRSLSVEGCGAEAPEPWGQAWHRDTDGSQSKWAPGRHPIPMPVTFIPGVPAPDHLSDERAAPYMFSSKYGMRSLIIHGRTLRSSHPDIIRLPTGHWLLFVLTNLHIRDSSRCFVGPSCLRNTLLLTDSILCTRGWDSDTIAAPRLTWETSATIGCAICLRYDRHTAAISLSQRV